MPFSKPRRPDWPLTEAATKLAGETEAWACGELADLRTTGDPDRLAPWLLLNRAAHADLPALRRGPSIRPKRRRHRAWNAAERDIVQHVLALVETPDDLVTLQRQVLVPLELRYVECSKTAKVCPAEIVATTVAALARVRLR